MKIKVKQTPESINKMLMDNVPLPVVEDIIGKVFDVDTNHRGEFLIPSIAFTNQYVEWNIRPECVEILSLPSDEEPALTTGGQESPVEQYKTNKTKSRKK